MALPELNISAIKAKTDAGFRTAALLAFMIETFSERGSLWVLLALHPWRHDAYLRSTSLAEVIDSQTVIDSGVNPEKRNIIKIIIAMAKR